MKRFRVHDAKSIEGPNHWFSDPNVVRNQNTGLPGAFGKSKPRDIQSPALEISLMGNLDPQRYVLRMVAARRVGRSAPIW
jgi:hypothetical protein